MVAEHGWRIEPGCSSTDEAREFACRYKSKARLTGIVVFLRLMMAKISGVITLGSAQWPIHTFAKPSAVPC